jgi:hypothetical protein
LAVSDAFIECVNLPADATSEKLSKQVLVALGECLTEDDHSRLRKELARLLDMEDDQERPSIDDLKVDGLGDQWGTGAEQYEEMTIDQLWSHLGVTREMLLIFTPPYADLDNREDPWATTLALEEGVPNVVNLEPKWHQLVAMVKILENAYEGRMLLEMDTVGLGKTLPMLWSFAVLRMHREHKAMHGDYPGAFSKSAPVLLVWTCLLRRFTSRGPQVHRRGRRQYSRSAIHRRDYAVAHRPDDARDSSILALQDLERPSANRDVGETGHVLVALQCEHRHDRRHHIHGEFFFLGRWRVNDNE